MYQRIDHFISLSLLEMAEQEYPELMGHPTNREDTLQELSLAQFSSHVKDMVQTGKESLARLSYELGLSQENPDGILPDRLPPDGEEIVPGTLFRKWEESFLPKEIAA